MCLEKNRWNLCSPLSMNGPATSSTSVVAGSSTSPRYTERALAIFLDNLKRYRAGETLKNVVDKELGY